MKPKMNKITQIQSMVTIFKSIHWNVGNDSRSFDVEKQKLDMK